MVRDGAEHTEYGGGDGKLCLECKGDTTLSFLPIIIFGPIVLVLILYCMYAPTSPLKYELCRLPTLIHLIAFLCSTLTARHSSVTRAMTTWDAAPRHIQMTTWAGANILLASRGRSSLASITR